MKLNSISNHPLYQKPKVNPTQKVVPKELQGTNFRRAYKEAAAGSNPKIEEANFSPQAEKILSLHEKVEIRTKFGAENGQDAGYSRRGKLNMKNASLGRKIDLKR
ncbi:hypothetical protein BMS3Abin05_02325 [bacterium BMS3Abin05]|nr:hypothetical protein BMS3Abin05_02325 [bacterium BMS3Abin05]GBE27909.1 hypothetical protein BMS3Bbin03_01840 [bacterium BMS3Bbin03]HDK35885.1 hypothetical protein [Bacteroidota bacterium]HDZ12393.1 hypothetical protein [Bacteroidota bacterium]